MRRGLCVLTLIACGGQPVLPEAASKSGPGASVAPGSPPAPAPLASPPRADAAPPANAQPPGTAVFRGRTLETACNGLDDDGDGVTDLLLPVGPNVCSTGQRGACDRGLAACEKTTRVCLAPPPLPEVFDEIDNDCNGVVDDVPARKTPARALLIAPRYAWTEAASDIATTASVLAQAGIPFDRQASPDWTPSLGRLNDYALVIIPGYLTGAALAGGVKKKLEAFAEAGGVVVVFKPIGSERQKDALALTGLAKSTKRRDIEELRFDAPSSLTAELDSPEERTLRLNAPARARKGDPRPGVELYLLEPKGDTAPIARGISEGAPVGVGFTRRPHGKGAIYAFGHDLSSYGISRCYVNCFEPSGDALRLALWATFREATAGHTVSLHTAPRGASGVVVLTHDVMQPESLSPGVWGEPAAKQFAELEKQRGVRATFFVAAGQYGGFFDPKAARELCDKGACSLGAFGVTQPRSFAKLPFGTCKEEADTYRGAPSLCGEVRVSREVLAGLAGKTPRVWRSPYLALHPAQFTVLAQNGIAYDSGFGVGDLPYNLPVDMAEIGVHQNRFRKQKLIEFPIALEDEIPTGAGAWKDRVVIDDASRARFETLWTYVLQRNRDNGSMTTVNVRASRGSHGSHEAIPNKVKALERLLEEAEHADVAVLPVEDAGDFWRARLSTRVSAIYEDAKGYEGAFAFGSTTVAGLGIDFGDRIVKFECDACGPTRLEGKRVVLTTAPPPGTKATFIARVR